MKRNLLIAIVTLLFVPFIMAQSQIENPGFEDWEDESAGSVEFIEPVNWSTIKTADDPTLSGLAPFNWERSEDAHSGQYCIKLYNTSALGGIPVVGTMTNGQYHSLIQIDLAWSFTNQEDPKWNTPFTARPDSIAFWLKYFPMEGDTLQFQALLHVDDAQIPVTPETEGNWVGYTRADLPGTYENWTRIALPFEYYDERTPEYLFMILTSGNGTNSIDGSVAYYDDLEMIGDDLAIHDNPLDQVGIHVSGNNVLVKNMPTDLLKHANLEILDLTGRSVWRTRINSNKVTLSASNNFNGMYIIKITSNDYVISRKVYFNR